MKKAIKQQKKKTSRNKKAVVQPGPVTPAPDGVQATDQARFVNDLLIRGEAAELTPDGKLPLEATHVIQKRNSDGSVEVKRARYKLA
jgi:hypothetical protein